LPIGSVIAVHGRHAVLVYQRIGFTVDATVMLGRSHAAPARPPRWDVKDAARPRGFFGATVAVDVLSEEAGHVACLLQPDRDRLLVAVHLAKRARSADHASERAERGV